MKKMVDFVKMFGKFLFLWDGLWSVPLAFVGFLMFGYFGQWFWGEGFGAMSPEFFQAVVFASVVIVFLNFVTWLGVYFNWKSVFSYYLADELFDNFYQLTPIQKICVTLFLYTLYFLAGLGVIVTLV